MLAPRIAPFHEVRHDHSLGLDLELEQSFSPQAHMFVVLSDGVFMDRWWTRGDVLVCEEGVRPGRAVVLITTGYGWPRLGTATAGGGMLGDAGEPCSPHRWSAVGAISAVLRRAEGEVRQDTAAHVLPSGWEMIGQGVLNNERLLTLGAERGGPVEPLWSRITQSVRRVGQVALRPALRPCEGDKSVGDGRRARQLSLFTVQKAVAA